MKQDPQITVAKVEAVVEARIRVKMGKIIAAARITAERSLSWIPPPQGSFKANVDAIINKEKGETRVGVVIKDGWGSVITAAVNRTIFYGNVAHTEATTVIFGIQIAMEADLLLGVGKRFGFFQTKPNRTEKIRFGS